MPEEFDLLRRARWTLSSVAKGCADQGLGQFESLLDDESGAAEPEPLRVILALAGFQRGLQLVDTLRELDSAGRRELRTRLLARSSRFASERAVLDASQRAAEGILLAVEALCPRLRESLEAAERTHDRELLDAELQPFLESRFLLSATRMLRLAFADLEPCLMAWQVGLGTLPPVREAPVEAFYDCLAPALPEIFIHGLHLKLGDWCAAVLCGVTDGDDFAPLHREPRAYGAVESALASGLSRSPQRAAGAMRVLGDRVADAMQDHSQALCKEALDQAVWLNQLALEGTRAARLPGQATVGQWKKALADSEQALVTALLGIAGVDLPPAAESI